jgi:hypothetical protein
MNVPVHESKVTNARSGVEPQAYFEAASVDPTDARNDILGCFGRSDRRVQFPDARRIRTYDVQCMIDD